MIPSDVNIADLSRQLSQHPVAFSGEFEPSVRSALTEDLSAVVENAEAGEFGSVGVVVLERTPAHTADLRDIAQDLLRATDLETVVVRAPGSGATVSETYSRAAIESAQSEFLANPDYTAATAVMLERVGSFESGGPAWALWALVIVVSIVLAMGWSAWSARR